MRSEMKNKAHSDGSPEVPTEITDKRGYAARWLLSPRTISNFLSRGMPHFAVGKRRVRIVVAEADAWMEQQFGTRRLGPANSTKGAL